MNSRTSKLLVIVLAVFVLVYVGYQAVAYFYRPYTTQVVYTQTVMDTVTAQATAFRDETVITTDQQGVTNYLFADGSRISKDTQVAQIFNRESDALAQMQIEELQSEIDMLKDAQETGVSLVTTNETLNNQITSELNDLIQVIHSRNVASVSEHKYEVLSLINKRKIATGQDKDFSARIQALNDQITSLQSSISSQPGAVTSPLAGYFCSVADGYEGIFTKDLVANLTIEQFEQLKSQSPASTGQAIGKVIADSEWYLVAMIDDDDIEKFQFGQSLKVDFIKESYHSVPVTVENIVKSTNGGQHMVVLKCTYISGVTSSVRNSEITIAFQNYKGIRVPNEAVRFENGERGVYVVDGNVFTYKTIDVIYEGDGFVLSRSNDQDNGQLATYDEVVTEGKDLYDQKPIR